MIFGFFSKPIITFRQALSSDSVIISKIHCENFAKGWSENEIAGLLTSINCIAHVAMQKTELVGFIISRVAKDEGELLSIAIKKSKQGQSIGANLLKPHLSMLAQNGVKKLFLEVEENNTPARKLYKSYGFVEIGTRKGYYSSPSGTQNAICMRLDIL